MQPACEIAQLLERPLQLGRGLDEQLACLLRGVRQLGQRDPKLDGERDQPLLGAVVQVALEPPASLVGGTDDPCARRRSSACARSLAIDWAARSAKLRSLISAPAGNIALPAREAVRAPSSEPPMITGAAITEHVPRSRDVSSDRLAYPVSRTASVALPGSGW